jgi:hypothetical protein
MSDMNGGSAGAGAGDAGAGDAGGSSAGSVMDWRASLDDTLRADPTLADIKDLNGLAKSYVHAQRMIGKDKIAIPGEGSDPSEWDMFYERLGRPGDGNYKLEPNGVVPDGLEFQPEALDRFKKIFHANGLTQKQAEGIFKDYMSYVGEQHNAVTQGGAAAREQWVNDVKREFGKAFDERVDLAVRAVETFGGQELMTWLDQTGLGDHPMFVKMFAKIGQQMQEALASPGQSRGWTMTPDSARQEIARMQRDKEFMNSYMTPGATGHKEAVQKMQDLFGFAYPDEVTQL